jgi:hypothetical protein
MQCRREVEDAGRKLLILVATAVAIAVAGGGAVICRGTGDVLTKGNPHLGHGALTGQAERMQRLLELLDVEQVDGISTLRK